MGKKKIFPSYEEAKRIVQENGIKTIEEYKVVCKDLGLPSNPIYTYKNRGRIKWSKFLGNGDKVYPSYEEAKKIVIENGIKSISEYRLFCKDLGLPSNPIYNYKCMGWVNWLEFLDKEEIVYPPYEEAKKIVLDNGIKTCSEYMIVFKCLGLPSQPNRHYIGKGWVNWPEFLDKEKIVYPSYEEAKKIVLNNGIKTCSEYMAVFKCLGLPSNPSVHYKAKGWSSYPDFFGKPKPISSSARKAKVYTTLSISPVLLEDDAPLQIIYMLASQIDKKLASEIEELLNTASCEDRLNMVKEQLKSLKAEAESMSASPSEGTIGELSAMESMMDVFEDTLDSLPEDTTEYLNSIIKNYYHNATNRALIAEYDD